MVSSRSALVAVALVAASCAPGPRSDRVTRSPRQGLTHPLLDVEPEHEFLQLKAMRLKLARLVGERRKAGDLLSASVYYRDLDNGPVVGLDDAASFRPASLLKLPIMIGYLKARESDPEVLQRRLVGAPERVRPAVQSFPPKEAIVPGRAYTVDELLTAVISRSDNTAVHTLIADMKAHDYAQVYSDLGLRVPDIRNLEDPVTVREYAAFFRILYNASYLSRDMSERALRYLAASDFDRGLRAGVPPEVVVAHKFGEFSTESGDKQLHDCGIIYHPRAPYLLCVMTRGGDLGRLADSIAAVSAFVYGEIDRAGQAR